MTNQTDARPQRGLIFKSTPEDQGLVQFPTVAPHLQFHNIGDEQMLLVSESFNTILRGAILADLLPLLSGKHWLDEIVDLLAKQHGEAGVRSALVSLTARGYVVSADHGMARDQAAYWTSLGVTPRYVEKCLVASQVSVSGDEGPLVSHLESSGISVGAEGSNLAIHVCDDYLEERFVDVNRHQLEIGQSWMLVQPRGMQTLFGPVFRADHDGPCWECLSYRMTCHKEVHNFLRHFAGDEGAFKPFATNPTVIEAIYRLVAAEVVKWLVLGDDAALHDQAIEMNVGTFEVSQHSVMRRPQCFACGDEDLNRPDRPPAPLVLKSSPKQHRNSGGAHTVAPEVTLEKYRHLISPISGVVTWLNRTTDETDSWLHVYWAGSNLGMRSRTLSSLRRSLRSKSAGKGSTRQQSEASALCEAIERYSGAFHGDEIRTRKRLTDFGDDDSVIHPNDVQLFSDTQFDNADDINAQGHPYNIVPQHLDENAAIDWSPVWSFTQKRHRYLPTSMLYSTAAEQRGPDDLVADSNGCAAGTTLEEAILQGFYELVERDAVSIWWYNRLSVPAVDLSSFDDEFLNEAKDYYARLERELWVLDVTSDFGIPSFVALSHRPNALTEDIIYGAGTHADPRIAALRAVCELNQCLTWLPRPGSTDGRPMIDDPVILEWWKKGRVANCDWLSPAANKAMQRADSFTFVETTDTRDDVRQCCELVEALGMDLLVLDQTRPDIGMPVVRVVVPGMRHFWPRLAPGRLFDVPVKQGYIDQPLLESEMNGVPVLA